MGEVYSKIGEELTLQEPLRESHQVQQQRCFHHQPRQEAYCRIAPVDQVNRNTILHPIESSLSDSSCSSHSSSSSQQHPAFMDYQVAPATNTSSMTSKKERVLRENQSSGDGDALLDRTSEISSSSASPPQETVTEDSVDQPQVVNTCHVSGKNSRSNQRKKLTQLRRMIQQNKKNCRRLEKEKKVLMNTLTTGQCGKVRQRHDKLQRKTLLKMSSTELRKTILRKKHLRTVLDDISSSQHIGATLICNPKQEYMNDQALLEAWTDPEKSCFREKFALFGKNFHLIAEHLPKKRVQDCVHFYYLSKKKFNFKELCKIRTRRSTCHLSSASSHSNKGKATVAIAADSLPKDPVQEKSSFVEKLQQEQCGKTPNEKPKSPDARLSNEVSEKTKTVAKVPCENVSAAPKSPSVQASSPAARFMMEYDAKFLTAFYSPCIKDIINSVIDNALSADYNDSGVCDVIGQSKEGRVFNRKAPVNTQRRKNLENIPEAFSTTAFMSPKQSEGGSLTTTKVSPSLSTHSNFNQSSSIHISKKCHSSAVVSSVLKGASVSPSETCQTSVVKTDHSTMKLLSPDMSRDDVRSTVLFVNQPKLVSAFSGPMECRHLNESGTAHAPSPYLHPTNSMFSNSFLKFDATLSTNQMTSAGTPSQFSRQMSLPSYPVKGSPATQWTPSSNGSFHHNNALSLRSSPHANGIAASTVCESKSHVNTKSDLHQFTKIARLCSTGGASVPNLYCGTQDSVVPAYSTQNSAVSARRHNVLDVINLLSNSAKTPESSKDETIPVVGIASSGKSHTETSIEQTRNTKNSINVRASDLLDAIIHKHIGEMSRSPPTTAAAINASNQKTQTLRNLNASSSPKPSCLLPKSLVNVTPYSTENQVSAATSRATSLSSMSSSSSSTMRASTCPSLANKSALKSMTSSTPLPHTMRGCIDKFIEDLVQIPTPPSSPEPKPSPPLPMAKKRGRSTHLSVPFNKTSCSSPATERVDHSTTPSQTTVESSFLFNSPLQSTKEVQSISSSHSSPWKCESRLSDWRSATQTAPSSPSKDIIVPLKKRPLPPQFQFDKS